MQGQQPLFDPLGDGQQAALFRGAVHGGGKGRANRLDRKIGDPTPCFGAKHMDVMAEGAKGPYHRPDMDRPALVAKDRNAAIRTDIGNPHHAAPTIRLAGRALNCWASSATFRCRSNRASARARPA